MYPIVYVYYQDHALTAQLGEQMPATEVDKIFETLDTNKDGKLDYKEFTGLYASTTKQLNHLISLRGTVDNCVSEKKTCYISLFMAFHTAQLYRQISV